MIKIRHVLILNLFLLFSLLGNAQGGDTLTFAKDRMLTSLFGSISNQQVDIASGGTVSTIGYTLGTKSGIFIKNNWALGLHFSLSKSDFTNTDISVDSENLLLGLWSRFYFSQKGAAILYAELTPFYTAIHRQNTIFDAGSAILVDEVVSGAGFGLLPGFGFTYIINRNVGFGMTLSYSMARLNMDIEDQILNNTVSDTYNVSQLQFSFDFQIYLDQFFF